MFKAYVVWFLLGGTYNAEVYDHYLTEEACLKAATNEMICEKGEYHLYDFEVLKMMKEEGLHG